jgi:hypothetical protein
MESVLEQPDTESLSPTLPTLDQVHSYFEKWRSTRECRGHIPPTLWNQVSLLIGRYNEKDICSKLRISKTRLKSAILEKSRPQPTPDTQTPVDFIPLTLSQTPSHSSSYPRDSIAAEIIHTNGITLRIPALNEQQFSNLLHIFIKGP